MQTPADDTLYNIRRKIECGEANDDLVFLYHENERLLKAVGTHEIDLVQWFASYFYGKVELIPDFVQSLNKKHEVFNFNRAGNWLLDRLEDNDEDEIDNND